MNTLPTNSPATRTMLFDARAIDQFANALFQVGDMDETLAKLGITRAQLKAQLEQDDEITAVTETRRDAAVATPWRLDPDLGTDPELIAARCRPDVLADIRKTVWPSMGPEADPAAWVWGVLETWGDKIMRAAWGAVPYGYSVQELVYGLYNGRCHIAQADEKPMQWFEPHAGGAVIYSDNMGYRELIDTTIKFHCTVREGTYQNPRGMALYSRLYWPWFFRVNGWKFWAKFLERHGVPFLHGRTPRDTDALAEALASAVSNSALATADDEPVEILQATTGTASFEQFETACIKRYQRLVLGQTLTSDTQGVGSQALGNVHNEVRRDKRDSDVRLITKTMQGVVDALWLLNNFPGKSPKFIMEDGKGLEAPRADRDLKLSQIGVELAPEYFMRAYDFEEGEVLGVSKPGVITPNQDNATGQQGQNRDNAKPGKPALKGSAAIEPVVELLRTGGNYHQAMTKLAELNPHMTTADLETNIAQAFFVADVFGVLTQQAQQPDRDAA